MAVYREGSSVPRARCDASSDVLDAFVDGSQQVVEWPKPPSARGYMEIRPAPGDAPYMDMRKLDSLAAFFGVGTSCVCLFVLPRLVSL